MRLGSKRGAALAYVIVITAALLILAAALISAAKFNVDFSQNSLEGRQAYLDAKSAIEYGRAYLYLNPGKADENFTILRSETGPGFQIGAQGAANAVAAYNSAEKTINAAAKYQSSDRVRRLGYRFEQGEENTNNTSGFLICGNVYGTNTVLDVWNPTLPASVGSVYPILSRLYRQTGADALLTAPKMYITGTDNGNSLIIYNHGSLTLKSDFIYLAGGLDTYSQDGIYRPLYLKTYSGKDSGVIYFGRDILKNGMVIAQADTYYSFKNGIDLYNMRPDDFMELTPALLAKQINLAEVDFIDTNKDHMVSGDEWGNGNNGTNWSSHGKIIGSVSDPRSGSGNTAPFILYDKQIQDSSHWIPIGLTQINNQNGYNSESAYKDLLVYWYLNDVSEWSNALFGNGDENSNQYYQNVSNLYLSKEINLRYVNNEKKDFIIPEYKTVIFQADTISLSTEYSDTVVGEGANRPRITHAGAAASFVLEAQNANDALELHVLNAITVQYKNKAKRYTIKAGYYNVTKLDLFTDTAKDFFALHPPTDSPGGGSGGSGGSGGGTLTGGVYTDGQ